MPVFWTVQAGDTCGRRWRSRSCREATAAGPGGGAARLSRRQETTWPDRRHPGEDIPGRLVVVKDQVIGYRRKKDLFILLVEVFAQRRTETGGPFVVKIGPEEKLRKEIKGWTAAGRRGSEARHGVPRPAAGEPEADEGNPWMSLVYGDAQQFLGCHVDRHLRRPPRGVRAERVPAGSVDRLRARRAVRADRPPALQPGVRGRPWPGPASSSTCRRLDDGLARLGGRALVMAARRDVNTLAAGGVEPVPRPGRLPAVCPGIRPLEGGDRRGAPVRPETPDTVGPDPARGVDLVPRMLRGCATATSTAGTSWSGSSATRRCGRPSSTTRTWAPAT